MTYEESIAYMSGLVAFAVRADREPFRRLLARLGNPERSLRCLHIAGTNGKGSTTTFVTAVLAAAGYRVGAYLSPFVFDMRERFQINGNLMPKEDFARLVSRMRPLIEEITADGHSQITEFEFKTAVAFAYFAEQQVDYAVIEVGIGGRLDSTNVIPPPLCAVITSIGLDHTNILGNTVEKIAAEKAGIFKPGTVGVTAVPPGPALETIHGRADMVGIPLYRVVPADAADADRAFATYSGLPHSGLTITLPSVTLTDLRPALRAAYQAQNAATAAAAIETLRQRGLAAVSDEALRRGLETASLPGRFQITRQEPATLLLDGAHNEDGARTLVEALQAVFGKDIRCTFVLGMSKNHDPQPFVEIVAPLAERIVATEPPFKPRPYAEVIQAAESLDIPVVAAPVARTAIERAYETARPGSVVVVTGSFFTIGETPESLRL